MPTVFQPPNPQSWGMKKNAEGLRPSARPVGWHGQNPPFTLFENEASQRVADADFKPRRMASPLCTPRWLARAECPFTPSLRKRDARELRMRALVCCVGFAPLHAPIGISESESRDWQLLSASREESLSRSLGWLLRDWPRRKLGCYNSSQAIKQGPGKSDRMM
jgi:hypothetical protein